MKPDKIAFDSGNVEVFKLISHHILQRHEVYTSEQLTKPYDEFTDSTKLRSSELKEMLKAKFIQSLSLCDELKADCIKPTSESLQK